MTLPWHLPVIVGPPPGGATLILSGGTPTVSVASGTSIAPAGAALALTAGTPVLVIATVIAPAGVALTLTGGAAHLTLGLKPAGISLTLTGAAAGVITAAGLISPGHATLTLTGGTPVRNTGRFFDSYRVAALSLADYVQPVYTGTGAKIFRASTSATTDSTSTDSTVGDRVLADATFDSIEIATADVAVNLTTGTLTVTTPGWFNITGRLNFNALLYTPSSTKSLIQLALYKNGVLDEYGVQYFISVYYGPQIQAIWSSFDVQLAAGDHIQLGVVVEVNPTWTTGNAYETLRTIGDTAGAKTYLSMTMLNKKVG